MSIFEELHFLPEDLIFGIQNDFRNDMSNQKVNLSVGSYYSDEGKTIVFDIVREVEENIFKQDLGKDYLPIDGLFDLKHLTQKLIFGNDSDLIRSKRICSVQSLSGTGALRLAIEFISRHIKTSNIAYISNPSWPIHYQLFSIMGFEVRKYAYWDAERRCLNIDQLIRDVDEAVPLSVIVLQACGHNPTGIDLNDNEWKMVKEHILARKLIPIIDIAYQGFVSGILDVDALPIRIFQLPYECSPEFFVCQSFAKNMGLYAERIGMLHIVCNDQCLAEKALTNLKYIIRSMYSNPPIHGARIVAEILNNGDRFKKWEEQLLAVATRINKMRQRLYETLLTLQTPGDWTHIVNQKGMFSFTGLSKEQCEAMAKKWHIYMTKDSRINVAALTNANILYVANAINDCVRMHT